MWLYVIMAFLGGAFIGIILMALLSANNSPEERIRELRHEMVRRMRDYYAQFKDQHGSAYDRVIAKSVVEEAMSIMRNTEV